MPLNGSGTYAAPASTWNPAVTNTTINSTDWVALLADLSTALSTMIAKDGQSTPTANIPMGTFKFTGLGAGSAAGHSVRWEQSAPGVVTTKGDLVAATASGAIGRTAVSTDGAVVRADSSQTNGINWGAPAGILAAGRNIASRTNSGTPNTKLDITADELALRNSTNGSKLVTSVSVTIDFGTVGANGLDASTQQASTWYYAWVIAKEDGTVAGLGSTSSSAPTLPSGYTYKALVSAARSDGSTHFVPYRQFGNTVYYQARQSALANGTATIETSITLSSLIPSVCETFLAQIDLSQGTATAATIYNVECRVVTGTNFYRQRMAIGTNNDFGASTALAEFPNTASFFYINSAANLGTNIDVLGFKLPLGGE